jgi:hypothetical protein
MENTIPNLIKIDEQIEENNTSPTTSSIVNYSDEDKNRIISSLVSIVDNIKKDIYLFKKQKLKEELQLSDEIIESSGLLVSKPRRLKRGRGFRPIVESEILDAQKHSPSIRGQAAYLNVSTVTYTKYAKMYGLYKPLKSNRGEFYRLFNLKRGKETLQKIFNGEYPNYSVYKLKRLLIKTETKAPSCENCGFCEKRITDNRIPILLYFLDGNIQNKKLENMKIYCYNCAFLIGGANIVIGSRKHWLTNKFNNPETIQGSKKPVPSDF